MNRISNAQHTNSQAISHRSLRSRFGTAFVAGCLALSVCPAVALAAPGDANGMQNGPDQMGNPPAAMQFDGQNAQQGPAFGGMQLDGQAPNGQAPADMGQIPDGQQGQAPDMGQAPDGQQGQAPDMGQMPGGDQQQTGQMPSGQAPFDMQGPSGMEPRTDAMDNQVRQILADKYGIATNAFGGNGAFQPGDPTDAPELPDGAANVQAVIDTARDILREYRDEDLASKIGDADFVAALKAYALSSTAQRMEMFANQARPTMENPADLPSDEAAAPGQDGTAPGATVSDDLMSAIIDLITDVFGYVNGAADAVAGATDAAIAATA